MRRLVVAIAIVWAVAGLAGAASAQSGEAMPGTVVGSTAGQNFRMIGSEQPNVGNKVGKPINLPTGNMMRPYNPANPYEQLQGSNLNPSSVVAPVNGYQSQVSPSLFAQVFNSMKSLVGLNVQAPPPNPNFTPGIFRRDLQRERQRFVRD